MPTSRMIPPPRQRRQWISRRIVAEWREIRVLFRQFRTALMAFAAFLIGGALVYNFLTVQAGEAPMPFGDSIFFMLELMVLEAGLDQFPGDLLREAFFFLMPLLGLSAVVGGVVSFGSALLNRSTRRDEWEVTLASTYSNHVIVCGVGHLGVRVIRQLVALNFDVVAIENNPQALGVEAARAMRVPVIIRDATQTESLLEAGVERADTLLVCTNHDMANIAITLRARELNQRIRIVVRMFDDTLASQIRSTLNVEAVYSASMLAAPFFAGAATRTEVAQSFCVGEEEYSMARLEVCPGSPLVGSTIAGIEKDLTVDVVLHITGDRAHVHPATDAVIKEGDQLVIFARFDMLHDIAARNRTVGC
ncbi:MAG: TrkA family potassium uptake protein [Anaerolineae bacterium]|nr:TrkA family potassium uptake protein [Anaerolineae bacterium]